MPFSLLLGLLLTAVLAIPCAAHPTFNSNAAVNAASFIPGELPGGAIARGSIFTVFGEQMGPVEGIQVSAFPLGIDLGGVAIQVKQGNQSVDAIPLFANSAQVNAVMPSNAPLGEVAIFVTFPGTGGTSFTPAIVQVVPASFGIFTINSTGSGPAVIQNFVSPAEQPLNSTLRSASPGQFVTLWGTGLGAITGPDNVAPPAGTLNVVEVRVGHHLSPQVLYAGRSPCCAGVDQIVFQVPPDAPMGCYVPVVIKTADGVTSNTGTISIAPQRGACKDALNPPITTGMRLGRVTLIRNSLEVSPGQIQVTDTATAVFESVASADWFFNPSVSMPAPGTCASYFSRGAIFPVPNPFPAQPLDAGVELAVRGPNGSRSVPRTASGFYASLLATTTQPPLYLDPGLYTLDSSGGAVGAVHAEQNFPTALTWTNRGDINLVDRSQGIFLTWTGGNPDVQYVRIFGLSQSSTSLANNVSGAFVCTVPLELGSFTVPPQVLANLPPSVASGAFSTGYLLIGASPKLASPTMTANGLDYGYVTYQSMVGKVVIYP